MVSNDCSVEERNHDCVFVEEPPLLFQEPVLLCFVGGFSRDVIFEEGFRMSMNLLLPRRRCSGI
jgi:hypothetical protein